MVVCAHLHPAVLGRLKNLHPLGLSVYRAQGFTLGGRLRIQLLMGGAFQVDDGQRALLCLNPKAPPYLLVETDDGTVYLFGSDEAEETRAVFAALEETAT